MYVRFDAPAVRLSLLRLPQCAMTSRRKQSPMSKHGFEGLGDLFRDLWRELHPLVRAGLFAGMGIGFALGLVFVLSLPPDYGRLVAGNRVQYRTILLPRVLIVLGIGLLGTFLGTAIGVTLELLFGRGDGFEDRE
jgi:hypothetical protein